MLSPYKVIRILPAGIGRNDCPVIGLLGTQGAPPLDLCLSVFEQCGGDLSGKNLSALLENAVVLPHDKLAGMVQTDEDLLALINRLATAGTKTHRFLLRLK